MPAVLITAPVARAVRQMWAAAARHLAARCDGPAGRPALLDSLEPRWLFSAALDLIGVTALRDDAAFDAVDGSGMSVVVIDTGVDFSHPLLAAGEVAAQDFVNGGTGTFTDEHGTHVAGIIGARDEDIGVAPGVGIIGLQVFSTSRNGELSANDADIESALAWVLANHDRYNIVAVNMSLGSGNYTAGNSARSSILYDDVKRLEAAGVTVVSAAGNSYADLEREGSAAPGVFSTLDVGAVYEANEGRVGGGDGTDFTTAADRVAYFSQRPDTDNEVFAPGAFITSTVPGGGTKDLAGTSMAAPMVTGVVALMQEAAQLFGGRHLSTAEVQSIVRQTADAIVDGDDENTSVQTTGNTFQRVNAYAAVTYVRNLFTGTGGGTGGGGAGEVDPNGTIATAAAGPILGASAADPIAAAVGTDGSTDVGGDDVDLYRVTVNSPGTASVTVDTAAFQAVVRLFNAAGTAVQSVTAAGNAPVTLSATLAAGTYYVGVSGAPNAAYDPTVAGSGPDGATGAYTLTAALDTADADGVLSGATDINLTAGNVAQALNASVGQDGAKAVGGGDVDFYRVTVPDDGNLLVDIDTPDAASYADTYLRVFDANGNQVASSDDNLAEGVNGQQTEFRVTGSTAVVDADGAFQGHRTDSFIGGGVTAGTVYYIAVGNYANRNFGADTLAGRVTTGSTGAYSLFVSFRNGDVNGAIPQAVATATLPIAQNPGTIGADGSTVGLVDVGDRDVDFIRLNTPAAGILKIDVDSYANAPGVTDAVDTTARLFDGTGKLLAFNEGGADGPDPLLYYEVEANTDYYLAVSGAGNDTFDPFLLGSGGHGDTGQYLFSAEILPASDAAALSDNAAGDGAVKTLVLDAQQADQIGDDAGFARGDTDVDLYRFTAPYSAEFTFAAGPDDDFGADTYLRVFDAAGNELGHDDNGGVTTDGGNTGASRLAVRLAAGQTYLVGVSGAGPDAGAYDPIAGTGAGHGDTGGYTLAVTAGERSIGFDAKRKATYVDADGTRVTVSLKGPGSGTVVFATAGDADAVSLVVNGATARTSLTVKGDTSVGQLVVNGSVKSVSGKGLDLTGDATISGDAKSLSFRNVTGGTVTVGTGGAGAGTGGPLTFFAAAVTDSALTAATAIRSLKVASWADTGGSADAVTAPTVAAVSAKGDFAANITADTIGKVMIGGTLTGDVRSTGNIAAVQVGSIVDASVFAGVATGFVGLPDSADDFVNAAAVIGSFAVRGKATGSFGTAAYVAAPTIRKAAVGTILAPPAADAATAGLAADLLGSVTGRVDRGSESSTFRYKNLSDPSQSTTVAGVAVRVV